MTADEFAMWIEFYRIYPWDDLHRYHRPAALIATATASQRSVAIEAAIEWLQPEPQNAGLVASDIAMMRTLGFKKRGA